MLPSLVLVLFMAGCIGTDLVEDPPLFDERIEVTPGPEAALQEGNQQTFAAVRYDVFGETVMGAAFSWASSNPAVASIDANGVAMALQPGQVMITAMSDAVMSAPVFLTVVADPNQVATVTVDPQTVMLELDAMQVFTASALNLDGNPVAGAVITWRHTNPAVATLSEDGILTATAAGTTQVIATADGIDSAPATVTISAPGEQRTGTFQARPGTSYTVEGMAILEQTNDGLLLHFDDDFVSSNGPALFVYLSPTERVSSNSLELEALKSTSGAQTYEVPGDVMLDTHNYVIIHCKPFNVTFGFAELQ